MSSSSTTTTTSSSSSNGTETDLHPLWMKFIATGCYAAIALLGFFGNSLVVFVVLRKRSMQTITNILITNLAVSDIIMSTVNVPLTPATMMFMDSWSLPAAVCKLMPMTMGVSVYVSTLTSTAIAVDRYFVIVHPFVPRMKTGLCLLIVSVIWIVAILISLPIAVFHEVKMFKNTESCIEDWKPEYRPVFTVISFVLQFLIPCSVITVCYAKVSSSLRNRFKNNTLANKSRTKEELDIRRKRRTNRMLIAMVGIFVVCWIPLNLLWMLKDANLMRGSEGIFRVLFFSCHVIAMSSVMYNPFLYGWMNGNFQNEFRSILPCLFPSRQQAGSASNMNTSIRCSTFDRTRQPHDAKGEAMELREMDNSDDGEANQFDHHRDNVDGQVDHVDNHVDHVDNHVDNGN